MDKDISSSIVPREKLEFGLEDADIPLYWFGGDPFKTRFFDAMSTMFPEGERYFITNVRAWRDQIEDPQLLEDVRCFIRQEAQHGMVHTLYNQRLQTQGINVEKMEGMLRYWFFTLAPRLSPPVQRLTDTVVVEHLTAIMAHCMFTKREVMADADPRVRAMFAWHSVEEVEHKSVAFDVLTKVAKGGYGRRIFTLLNITYGFNLYALIVTWYMLGVDGMGVFRRLAQMARGVWWLFKPGGFYWPALGHYRQFFRRDFHPCQSGEMDTHRRWVEAYERTGDPIQAGEELYRV